jgi:hypothetical protein
VKKTGLRNSGFLCPDERLPLEFSRFWSCS